MSGTVAVGLEAPRADWGSGDGRVEVPLERNTRGFGVVEEAYKVGIRFVGSHASNLSQPPKMADRPPPEVSPFGKGATREDGRNMGAGDEGEANLNDS